jgi:hypothetical protein
MHLPCGARIVAKLKRKGNDPSIASATRGVGLAELDRAVIQKGTIADELDCLGVIGCAEHQIAADDFLGFAVITSAT